MLRAIFVLFRMKTVTISILLVLAAATILYRLAPVPTLLRLAAITILLRLKPVVPLLK